MGLATVARLLSPQEWQFLGIDLKLANSTMVALLAAWSLLFAVLAMVTGLAVGAGVLRRKGNDKPSVEHHL